MNAPSMSRRGFLKQGSGVLMGTLLFAAGPVALMTPSRSWALPLQTLSEPQAKSLLQFVRLLYPHKGMEDAVYALVVKDLDGQAQQDAKTRALLIDGIGQLDAGGAWASRDAAAQHATVKALEGTAFFDKVRATAVVALYSNDMAYAYFDYGATTGDAGYLYAGFNDLTWLPDLPANASGPIPTA